MSRKKISNLSACILIACFFIITGLILLGKTIGGIAVLVICLFVAAGTVGMLFTYECDNGRRIYKQDFEENGLLKVEIVNEREATDIEKYQAEMIYKMEAKNDCI